MSNRIPLRVLTMLRSSPFALPPERLKEYVARAQREQGVLSAMMAPSAVERSMARTRDDTPYLKKRGQVATVYIQGPITRYASWLNDLCGISSYDDIADAFNNALDDDAIRSIILMVDSPGGEVSGCQDVSDMIYAARGVKTVVAVVDGMCCSAAYWLASAAASIIVSPSAIVGSLGVVGIYEDDSVYQEKIGIKDIEVVSSQSPHKRPDVTTDPGRARIQALIDGLADEFLGSVARNRGVSLDVVMADYGQGDVMPGRAAVLAGLADEYGSYTQVDARLRAMLQSP